MANASLPVIPPLSVPLRKQAQPADCLAACAAMVLDYLGMSVDYAQLLATLRISSIGSPRRNITRLARFGLNVIYGESDLQSVAQQLTDGHPVITFVDTAELPYWSYPSNHAVVIVGLDENTIILNDPAFTDSQQRVPVGDFELAWLNCDNACAVITR